MKSEIRNQYKIKRKQMTKKEVEEKSFRACDNFLASDIYKNSKILMLYMPLGNETDTTKIIKRAYEDGKKVVFPVTERESGVITPYFADENAVFEKGAFNVNEPKNGAKADLPDIDVILVPGIAFDRKGARVGFGKGCYDRLLKDTDAVKAGFCYDFQVCDGIPAEKHDVTMDFLVTETEMITIK